MPDRDVILAKTASVQRCLKRIRDVTGLDPARLDDLDAQDMFVLNLQRAVQSSIDLATHIVASEGLGLSDTVKGNFVLLENAGIIRKTLSGRMQALAGFRNIAIYDYQGLDVGILKSILSKHLKDLEDFYTAVLLHYGLAKKRSKNR